MSRRLLSFAFSSLAIVSSCSGEPQPVSSCELAGSWHFGSVGGLTTYARVDRLAPPDRYSLQITAGLGLDSSFLPDAAPPDWLCSNAIPGCGGAVDVDGGSAPVTVADINRAFADADVEAAFASSLLTSPVVYGHDARPEDGSVLQVGRDTDGRGFLVGGPCDGASCSAAPAGLVRLAALLRRLAAQQTTGTCFLPD